MATTGGFGKNAFVRCDEGARRAKPLIVVGLGIARLTRSLRQFRRLLDPETASQGFGSCAVDGFTDWADPTFW